MPHPTHRSLPPTDPAHFRTCLSRFATGVTIIATRDSEGRFVGLTANSFNSLSLDPPLILWSLGHRAATLDIFKGQRYFSISVLAVDQVQIARQFAIRQPDRFKGVAVHEGLDRIPLIDGALAWFECERLTQVRHGDHWLFIGEVKRCAMAEGSPLVFRHGEFAVSDAMSLSADDGQAATEEGQAAATDDGQAAATADGQAAATAGVGFAASAGAGSGAATRGRGRGHPGNGGVPPSASAGTGAGTGAGIGQVFGAASAGSLEPGEEPFYEEYLPYLLARAGHHVTSGFHRYLRRHGLSMLSWRLLASLSVRDDWTVGDLAAVCLAKQPTVSKMIDRLEAQHLLWRRQDPSDARRVLVALTPVGRKRIGPVLTDASAFNLSVLASYPPESLTAMKELLKDMIARFPVNAGRAEGPVAAGDFETGPDAAADAIAGDFDD
jgi:flavin reductase (DIM6/NTAB) family NADH-FMN oxidoreductase RutF/DNA-binding MarR family transcriptional regulator